MKVLHFSTLYFKLPDDFDGGLSDALRALADYHDLKTGTPDQKIGPQTSPPDDVSADAYEDSVWEKFCNLIASTDLRVHGTTGLSEFPEEGPGVHLDLNTGVPDEPAGFAERILKRIAEHEQELKASDPEAYERYLKRVGALADLLDGENDDQHR